MKKIACIALCVALVVSLAACSGGSSTDSSGSKRTTTLPSGFASIYDTVDKLSGHPVGVVAGTGYEADVVASQNNPKVVYYNDYDALVESLTDCYTTAIYTDRQMAKNITADDKTLTYIETGVSNEYAFAFASGEQGNKYRAEMNAFLGELGANVLNDYAANWYNDESSALSSADYTALSGKNGSISVYADPRSYPLCYYAGGSVVGLEVQLLTEFCEKYGYTMSVQPMSSESVADGLSSGDATVGIGAIRLNDANKESYNLSESYYAGTSVAVLRNSDIVTLAGLGFKLHSDLYELNIGVVKSNNHTELARRFYDGCTITEYDSYDAAQTSMYHYANDRYDISAYLVDEPTGRLTSVAGRFRLLSGALSYEEFAFAFGKNSEGAAVRDSFNEFYSSLRDEDKLADIYRLWFGRSRDEKKVIDAASLTAKSGKLTVAYNESEGFCYNLDGKLVGYDVDLITRFCERYGYGVEFVKTTAEQAVSGVASGSFDIAIGRISVNAEREKSVSFSERVYLGGVSTMTKVVDEYDAPEDTAN